MQRCVVALTLWGERHTFLLVLLSIFIYFLLENHWRFWGPNCTWPCVKHWTPLTLSPTSKILVFIGSALPLSRAELEGVLRGVCCRGHGITGSEQKFSPPDEWGHWCHAVLGTQIASLPFTRLEVGS